jgi:hypothetical protein
MRCATRFKTATSSAWKSSASAAAPKAPRLARTCAVGCARTPGADPPFDDGNYLAHGVDLAIRTKESADYTAVVSGEVTWPAGKLEIYIQPHPVIRRMTFSHTMTALDNIRHGTNTLRNLGILEDLGGNRFESDPQLLRVQSKGFELPAPFCRRTAQPFNSDATRQPTFDRRPNKTWREECE